MTFRPIPPDPISDVHQWRDWFFKLQQSLNGGYTGTVALAKLTAGGANGSMTFTNGILTSYTAPT